MGNLKATNGLSSIESNEKTSARQPAGNIAGQTAGQVSGQIPDQKTVAAPDQDRFTRGIRDLGRAEAGDALFIEAEQEPSDRRDPEESRYNEAGQRVATQGDLDADLAASKKTNPEGSKISNSQPQTAL